MSMILSRVLGTSMSRYHRVIAMKITVVNAVKSTVITKKKVLLRRGVGSDTRAEIDSGAGSILLSSSFQLDECNPVVCR